MLSGLVCETDGFLHAVSAHCWGGVHQFLHSSSLLPEVHSVFKLNRKLVLVVLSWSCSLD